MNREDTIEARDLEDLADVLVGADDRQRAAGRAQALHAADQDPERGRVDESGLREVDDDLLLPLLDDLDHPLLELGRRVEVDLATELDHMRLRVDLFVLDAEVHVTPLWCACGPIRRPGDPET